MTNPVYYSGSGKEPVARLARHSLKRVGELPRIPRCRRRSEKVAKNCRPSSPARPRPTNRGVVEQT